MRCSVAFSGSLEADRGARLHSIRRSTEDSHRGLRLLRWPGDSHALCMYRSCPCGMHALTLYTRRPVVAGLEPLRHRLRKSLLHEASWAPTRSLFFLCVAQVSESESYSQLASLPVMLYTAVPTLVACPCGLSNNMCMLSAAFVPHMLSIQWGCYAWQFCALPRYVSVHTVFRGRCSVVSLPCDHAGPPRGH